LKKIMSNEKEGWERGVTVDGEYRGRGEHSRVVRGKREQGERGRNLFSD
jgi:hypothetical protein